MTRMDEYETLLERSRRFCETASMQIERGFYDLAVFSLEQGLQLFLKACLLKLGADYPRTHSVRKLLELIVKVSGGEAISDLLRKFSVELGALEDAYITSRYVPRGYSPEEVERLRKVVEEVMAVVGGVVDRGGEAPS
ncbi:MAG: HEPN domain-containing protein [Candidatus Verstraetearchaeota archaeon]|nr:HEPN domain-containing protein [Candidatus Verstraetearchaeota archaeon]